MRQNERISQEKSWFTKLDVFPKSADEVTVKTTYSGAVTLVTVIAMFWLLMTEFVHYITPDTDTAMTVDVSLGEKLRINYDITLPGIGCNNFGIDAVDSAGDQHLEIVENNKKVHIGAGHENEHNLVGCRTSGHLLVNKVKGEFHIAFGRKAEVAEQSNQHIHKFNMNELLTFNCSHIINRMSFGEDFPGVVQPMDGVTKIVSKGLGRYQYFVQIVPTTYRYLNGELLQTNQYSFTEHDLAVDTTGQTFKQPGIFFKYELSPYTVLITEKQRSFTHFLTSCCATLGGIFVVSGMLSSTLWYMACFFNPKLDQHSV